MSIDIYEQRCQSTRMVTDGDLLAAFEGLDGTDQQHSNGTLRHHLIGVRDLLSAWGMPSHVVAAGLFHSAYGTQSYRAEVATLDNRAALVSLIGEPAERLVYLYCVADRSALFRQLPDPDAPMLLDRHAGTSVPLDRETFAYLIHLLLADRLEQLPRRGELPDDDEPRIHLTRAGTLIWHTAQRTLTSKAWAAFQADDHSRGRYG
ncbi:hypothetical protein CS0771_48560 [Catellatospora sp. IY07-71]|uniref:DUF6817 domain-containing protein n=1 Tax=Catellatospora sp. IY07-71 TaxID=2728827 RepID=UPI001BB3316D|nr:hypothetical protein [Catellatospora sp. IY07-71]BCJ75312.1 hypothetical protein CS0771_48560 [Catellatospora sp. IY07-71]